MCTYVNIYIYKEREVYAEITQQQTYYLSFATQAAQAPQT